MPIIKVGPRSDKDLQQIADAIGKSRKVIVFTGAGISTNCGIPVGEVFNYSMRIFQAHSG